MLGKGRQRTPKDMRASKAVAVGLALGVPVAVTVFEVIGGPATVTGTSMQVEGLVNYLRELIDPYMHTGIYYYL